MTTLAEAASVPAVAQILASDTRHTDVARKITDLGYPTSETSVRRWRARRAWTASREHAAVSMAGLPVPVAPDLAEQGYVLSEAMRPIDLPDDPVTVLGYLEPYIGPAHNDLKAVRKTDSDGITTLVVTAVRDDFAEAAASLMATRIVSGEGEHRSLERHSNDCATVYWHPTATPLAPLFPGSSLTRYRRYANALVRKMRAVGWCVDRNGSYSVTFRRGNETGVEAALRMLKADHRDDGIDWDAIEAEADHKLQIKFEGL